MKLTDFSPSTVLALAIVAGALWFMRQDSQGRGFASGRAWDRSRLAPGARRERGEGRRGRLPGSGPGRPDGAVRTRPPWQVTGPAVAPGRRARRQAGLLSRLAQVAFRRPTAGEATWGDVRDARHLLVPGPVRGRICLGTMKNRLVAAERGHSLLVIGPTQCGKTSGLAIPSILEWDGPVLAASVKSDLAAATIGGRSKRGRVGIYDPTGGSGLGALGFEDAVCGWSPLATSAAWGGARRMAGMLTDAARARASGIEDAEFWYRAAAKLMAPLLLAAAVSGRTMGDVVRWLDTQEINEVAGLLDTAGEGEALLAAEAVWRKEERQLSSIYSTAEIVLEPFGDPDIAASEELARDRRIMVPEELAEGGTLYLCAPAHGQRRAMLATTVLVTQILEGAYERSLRQGGPLDPPLLVVIDEAANVAPVVDLDSLASTAASHGIQLVTVWQDLAQLNARYGYRASSVANNHRAKLFFSGISDPPTLELASQLAGDTVVDLSSDTFDGSGHASSTRSPSFRRLLAADALRRMPPGWATLIYAHLPPLPIRLRSGPGS